VRLVGYLKRNLWARDLFPEKDDVIIEQAFFYIFYKPRDNPAGSNMMQFFQNKVIIFLLNGFVGLCYPYVIRLRNDKISVITKTIEKLLLSL
jgi:hypothetical protein